MSVDLPPKTEIETETPRAEAAKWMSLKRSSAMTAHDEREFKVWLADAANAEAYDALERHWRALGAIADDSEIMSLMETRERQFNRPAQTRRIAAIAATVAIVGAGGWFATRSDMLANLLTPAPAHEQEFRTSVGQRTTLSLPDGSVVTLDTDSVLRARTFGRERRVTLERGRAFFKVAPDKSRPFIVAADGKTVTAIGTAFDVRVDKAGLEVILAQGRVRVQSPQNKEESADMRAGWRLLAHGDEANWKLVQVDIDKETSWLSGRLNFFNDPLGDAAAEMNRYSEKKIVIRDPSLASKPVVGVFRAGDVEAFVRAVRLYGVADVAVETDDFVELKAL